MEKYDIIIAGGGCAGLSLAYHLIHSPLRNRSILIVDRDDKDQNDRTWAFWSDRPTPFQPIVEREWRRLRFVTEAGERLIPTDPWRYVMIRGDRWYSHIRGLLSACPNVTWLKAPVKRIEDQADGALVYVDPDGHGPAPVTCYHAQWVFDSLFDINTFKPDLDDSLYLQQHFKGWYIETPDDCFDVEAATIFDFRTPQANDQGAGEMRFFYVLPTSPRAALVEYVGQHLVDFDALLDRYVRQVLGISNYRVVSDEIGITPMTDYAFTRRLGAHIMAVGIQGGLAKATTGYAYTRIQDDSAAIVASLMECGHPFAVPDITRPGYRLLDSVMLQVMQANPTCLKPAFAAMFNANPGPQVFRFLDERASFREVIQLVMTLPRWPFVAGAVRLAASRIYHRVIKRTPAASRSPRQQPLDTGRLPRKA